MNVELQSIGATRVRVKSQWTIVHARAMFQGSVEPATPGVPIVSGTTIFMPQDPLRSPVYIFVNYIHGRRIRVSCYLMEWLRSTDIRVAVSQDL